MNLSDADAKILQDLTSSGLTEAEALDALSNIQKLRRQQKKESEMPTGVVRPSMPPKKAETIVKTAKKGGYVKSADGCAKRGKTRGRFV